ERLFGEILVGLDRSGQLRRLATGARRPDAADGSDLLDPGAPSEPGRPGDTGDTGDTGDPDRRGAIVRHVDGGGDRAAPPVVTRRSTAEREAAPDPVERLLALIRDELASPTQTRLTEIEPGRWWLAEEADQAAAAPPLADRVEWAVFSLLSTAGPLSETAFFERIATLFSGHDLPDETLVRACLDSYRSLASTPDHLVTSEDLLRRSQEHTELLAALTNAGHRLGMRVWLAPREQARRHGRGHLADLLAEREVSAYLGSIGRPVDALGEVDAIWYIRNKVALLFEVEWTAMLGEPLLRRHGRIEPDDRLIRFLVIAPERTELVRHKLDRSPLLRSAMERGGWTIIKWDHLRTFLDADMPDLDDLEPLIGLDPIVERGGEQMPLFGG
ncbi:MAG: hypothetical protein ACTS8Z_07175, partial [Candidatus Limnocylindrales bacterium]